ncbi:CHASE2 domain-containing protein [Cyanothece sp. BG0011]|uniref:CHASE2 domain-containing protein n=1 Tax=Cyanothece sp. BG0011 TaxID=2082950 RepID=UPI0018E5620B|nr:CHASE2 domain-containing protein [Cyanothece sp. BG0011]
MFTALAEKLYRWRKMLLIPPTVTGLVIGISLTGILEPLELLTFDQFFRWRSHLSSESEKQDPRIVIITVDEADISTLQQWPLSDAKLAQLINIVKQETPRVIGLNIFRDFPIEPGSDALNQVLNTTPNLIGIEKVIGNTIKPPEILSQSKQVGFVDLVIDSDGKVRRDLITITSEGFGQKLSFAMTLALSYLQQDNILAHSGDSSEEEIIIGNARLFPLDKNAGNYINIDNGGYQILLNYRGGREKFQTISILDVFTQQYPEDFFDDRLVLIGVTADSVSTSFLTPYHPSYPISGTLIQANAISQILNAALDDRPLLKVWSDPFEWLWILTCTTTGMLVTYIALTKNTFQYNSVIKWLLFILNNCWLGLLLLSGSYFLFLQGWWVPTITPLIAVFGSSVIILVDKWKYLATFDTLTKVPNRLYFDKVLEQTRLLRHLYRKQTSLILCDVDHFKQYNDTYGHPAGDRCLKKVAQGIRMAIRHTDFLARYGGEEFAIILPKTDIEEAKKIAQRILEKVTSLKISHKTSSTKDYVTISCGISSLLIQDHLSTKRLIKQADKALYKAKQQGRNRVIVYEPSLVTDEK